MNQIEIWKKVAGFDKYSVSDQGNVTNDKWYQGGYLKVDLRKDKKSFSQKVHRLVAGAFLLNQEKKDALITLTTM